MIKWYNLHAILNTHHIIHKVSNLEPSRLGYQRRQGIKIDKVVWFYTLSFETN